MGNKQTNKKSKKQTKSECKNAGNSKSLNPEQLQVPKQIPEIQLPASLDHKLQHPIPPPQPFHLMDHDIPTPPASPHPPMDLCGCHRNLSNTLDDNSCFILNPNMIHKIPNNLLTTDRIYRMNNCYGNLSLPNNVFLKQGWNTIFPYVKTVKTDRLVFFNNTNTQILIQIQHVSFPKLVSIDLSRNNIESIEALTFFDAPNLKQIDFRNNNILSIKPVAKCKFNRLESIKLSGNSIKDWDMSRLQTEKQKIKSYSMSFFTYQRLNDNLIVFAKLKSRRIKRVQVCTQTRKSLSLKVQKVLKRKYPEVKIE